MEEGLEWTDVQAQNDVMLLHIQPGEIQQKKKEKQII